MLHHKIHRFQEVLFKYVFYLNYILYFVIAFGLSAKAPQYLSTLDYLINLYVSLFLIYRFNPLRKVVFTDLDRQIAFSSGIFVFATTTINKILISSLEGIKDFIFSL